MTETPTTQTHPEPPADRDHWVVDADDGKVHLTGSNAVAPCGERSGRVKHYRQMNVTNEEDWIDEMVCGDCLESTP